jgi:hypothetical protein
MRFLVFRQHLIGKELYFLNLMELHRYEYVLILFK